MAISAELLSDQRTEAAKVRAIAIEAIAKLRKVYPPFSDYLPGGGLDELIHDLEFWTREPDDSLEQQWRDLAAEADELEDASEADFRNDLKWENA